jgi:hypothetical protein
LVSPCGIKAASALTVATHSITAVCGGSSNFLTSTSNAITQTVNKTTSALTLASFVNPSTINQSVTFTATYTPTAETGTFTFKDGDTTLGTEYYQPWFRQGHPCHCSVTSGQSYHNRDLWWGH